MTYTVTIKDVREIDDAGGVHYESVWTNGLIVDSVKDGTIALENNIRPDWSGGKVMPKTKRKIKKWAKEILDGTIALGNLSLRLDPAIQVRSIEHEDGRIDLEITFDNEEGIELSDREGLDTGVDSQSRIEAMLLAEKMNPVLFNRKTRSAVRIWVANVDKASEVAAAYNTRGDRVNDSASTSRAPHSPTQKLAAWLVKDAGNVHLSSNNIEILSNTVSGGSAKLVGFHTLDLALQQEWLDEPMTPAQIQAMGTYISEAWSKLVMIRPEFACVPITDRKKYRATSVAGTALSVYGIMGVIFAGYTKGMKVDELEGYLQKLADGKDENWMALDAPEWQKLGIVVPSVLSSGTTSYKTRNTFQTRTATAKAMKARVGLI